MRTKSFVMSMGLAASIWLTGCQTATQSRVARSAATGDLACTSKTCRDSAPTEKAPHARSEKTTRVAARSGPQSTVPPAACSTCAKCGGGCDSNGQALQPTPVVQAAASSCSTCAASAGSVNRNPLATPPSQSQQIAATLASLPPGQHQVIVLPPSGAVPQGANQVYVMPNTSAAANPSQPQMGIPGHDNSPMMPGIVAPPPPIVSTYGEGVDVVTNQQPVETPASIPGERTVNNDVMTVRFGAANNHQIVVGQVYQFRRAWKLRYAAVESDDKYGGSLTLVGEGFDNLRDGQMVRVEGSVLPSDDRAAGARYQVQRLEVIEPDVK